MKKIQRWILFLMVVLLALGCMSTSALAFDNTGWYWPVPDSLHLSRGYFEGHYAIDIISQRGVNETVVAARSGTVVAVYDGCYVWDGCGDDHSGCAPVAYTTAGTFWGSRYVQDKCCGQNICNFGVGRGVIIDHGNGVWSEYSHMASINVSLGQYVNGATPIGTMGSYGNSTGRHLHFAIKTNSRFTSIGYHSGTAVNTNAYGPEYIIWGDWNRTDNIWYSRDYASANNVYFDVNATLDGANVGTLEGFGTCDVYINDELKADDQNDYYVAWPANTRYKVTNIKAAEGYSYVGEPEYTGALGTSLTEVRLPFLSHGTLELTGMMDGVACNDIAGLGTCDIYVDDELVAQAATSFSAKFPQGAAYRIDNIVAADGKAYEGATPITGTIGQGLNTVQLAFGTLLTPGATWQEAGALPPYITEENCDIQYKHSYQMSAETSPGEGWIQGEGTTVYTKVGGETESFYHVSESDTHRLVRYHYYHFCGPNAGDVANYAATGNFVHYDAVDPSSVYVTWQGSDGDDVNIPAFTLNWNGGGQVYCQSGATCDGAYGTHGARSRAWYRMNVYQDYVKSTTYAWTKEESDWMDVLDPTATSVRYRFRLKDAEAPVIDSVEITSVTDRGYTLLCTVSDDAALASVRVGTWKASETMEDAKWQTIEVAEGAKTFAAEVSVSIADFDAERDCFYYNAVCVTDKAGNETQYASDVRIYVPAVLRTQDTLVLPADLTTIEAHAFENDDRIGEVILPQGVESIGSRAFADCQRLALVHLSASVTDIAPDAFAGSANVVLVCPAGSAAQQLAQEMGWPYVTVK